MTTLTRDAADAAEQAETQPPQLYAGKYETVEKLEEAYERSQAEHGRRNHEIGVLRRENEELRRELAFLRDVAELVALLEVAIIQGRST